MVKVAIAILVVTLSGITSNCWAQQKHTVNDANSKSHYVQEHIINVADQPGHQIRVYEIAYEYPDKDLEFDGVKVKSNVTHGMSDYINLNGAFTTYVVYSMEDGSEIHSRTTGTTQTMWGTDGKQAARKYSFVEHFVGGTKRFKGIRGQVTGSGERAPGANSLTESSSGEYWIEQ